MAKTLCKGKTNTGAACRAAAGKGGLCFFHANPESAKKLGQLGGRKNRRSIPVDLPITENMTLTDLSKLNGQAMRLLLAGELQAREATAFAQLCNSQLRVIQGVDLEARVAMLEAEITHEQAVACTDADEVAQEVEVDFDKIAHDAETNAAAQPAVEPTDGTNGGEAAPFSYPNPPNTKGCAWVEEEKGEQQKP